VIDQVLIDAVFGVRIDQERSGAGGFSLEGYTMIEIAAGITGPFAWHAFCNSPQTDAICITSYHLPPAGQGTLLLVSRTSVVLESRDGGFS
jgi:predicted dienelactone hydrolase